jgi:DNA polymerase elongation subunit (family B)
MNFLDDASRIRPSPPKTLNTLSFQLVHGHVRDGLPVALPLGASEHARWKDDSYTLCADETSTGDAAVCLFGVTCEGNSAMVVVKGYRPSIRVELPVHACSFDDAERIRSKIASDFRIRKDNTVTLELESLKRFYGWVPERDSTSTRRFTYALLRFSTWKGASTASYILEREGFTLTDKNVKPLSKFMNDMNLTPADWIEFKQPLRLDTKFQRLSNCQMEFTCETASIFPTSNDTIAPLVICSFDGEMFSHDGSFPSVLKGDSTIYIGATFWTYGSAVTSSKKFVLCVGDIEMRTSDIILARFATSREMIEGFRDLLVAADPDIVTGWNTYGFDYPFLHEDYTQSFLMPWERGSEELQVAAIQAARSAVGLASCQMNTSASLLSKLRSKRGNQAVKDWLKKAERKYGSRQIKILLRLEKSVTDSVGSLADFGGDRDHGEDDDDAEEVGISGLSAKIAATIRHDLREEISGTSESSTNANFSTLLRDGTPLQIEEFWKSMRIQGEAVVEMLRAPVAPSGAMRGLCLSRFAAERVSLVEKRMSSAAKGDNTYYFWGMTGRVNVDLMQIIKDDKKPDDNTLKFAGEHWLGGGIDNTKIDLSAADMFAAYKSNDLSKRWEIAEYCSRDCDIPIRLISKLSYVPIWIEMSRVCYTWTHEVVNSGQQVKVFNLISRFVHGEYALNVADSGWPKNSYDEFDEEDLKKRKPDYQGATVIEPIAGFYPDCISTLDFESLYPSIIRYFNLCPSVLVLDPMILTRDGIEAETHDIQHNIMDRGTYRAETRSYSFVTHVQGVLPKLLKRLLDARKVVKRMMADCTDPAQKAVLNGRQNGIKVACNSVYGFCGVSADRGLLPCKPVAAVTTLKGRAFIEAAKTYVESHYFGSKVIYGDTDSVMIFWGKDVEVSDAALKGEEAADAITSLLRSGSIASIGGAGALAASALEAPISPSSGNRRSPVRDLSAACSAVTLAYEKTYRPYLLLKKRITRASNTLQMEKADSKQKLI